MNNTFARILATAVVLSICFAAAGCAARNPALVYRYDMAGIPHAFKRFEQCPQRDFLHHWMRKVYHKPPKTVSPREGADQGVTLKEWGKPDWIRKPFRSMHNELVEEWVYINKGRVFQFTGDKLVYEGPLTDYEQVLLYRGYPDRAIQLRMETGNDLDVFIYRKVFSPVLEEMHFVNGLLTQAQEGN
jgi:hypothetical protein